MNNNDASTGEDMKLLKPFFIKEIWLETVNYLKKCNELFENKLKRDGNKDKDLAKVQKKYIELFNQLKYKDSISDNYLSNVMDIINKEISDFRCNEIEFYHSNLERENNEN